MVLLYRWNDKSFDSATVENYYDGENEQGSSSVSRCISWEFAMCSRGWEVSRGNALRTLPSEREIRIPGVPLLGRPGVAWLVFLLSSRRMNEPGNLLEARYGKGEREREREREKKAACKISGLLNIQLCAKSCGVARATWSSMVYTCKVNVYVGLWSVELYLQELLSLCNLSVSKRKNRLLVDLWIAKLPWQHSESVASMPTWIYLPKVFWVGYWEILEKTRFRKMVL